MFQGQNPFYQSYLRHTVGNCMRFCTRFNKLLILSKSSLGIRILHQDPVLSACSPERPSVIFRKPCDLWSFIAPSQGQQTRQVRFSDQKQKL